MRRAEEPLTLYPSLRGLVAVLATPHLLILIGAWGLSAGGATTVGLGFVAVGVLAAAAGLFGYPRHVVVSREGIELVSVLRRRRLAWDAVRGIERTRSARGALRAGGAARSPAPRPEGAGSGGLLARGRGRRHWMLTDHVESPDEYDHLCEIVAATAGGTSVRAQRPQDGTPPTWLYRRRRPSRPAA